MENKMGTMPMPKLMITMSLPIMISMLVQALYNIVDSMFVARLSQDALAAVSLCYPVQTIMIAIACGTGVGFNTLLSRCLGERNTDKANQVVLHGLMIALVNWLLFVVLGFLLARPFLMLFSGQKNVIDMGVVYLQICNTLSFGIFIQITYERILQASGQPVYNMIMQGIGALVNIILDPIFIFGYFGIPAMGVAGAALATVLGQIIAMLLGIWIVQKKAQSIQIHIRSFSLDFSILKQIYKNGFPAILMQSIMSFMTVFMNQILVPFSLLAVNVFSIYYKLQQFVFMAVLGMTNALVPILAYNYGAKAYSRIQQAIRISLELSIVIMAVGTLIFQIFPSQLLLLFDANVSMMEMGIPALRIISFSFVFAGISMVLGSVFQALGHPNTSLWITLLRQLVVLVPLTYVFASIFGLNICWLSFVLTEILCAILSLVALRYVDQKTIQPLKTFEV